MVFSIIDGESERMIQTTRLSSREINDKDRIVRYPLPGYWHLTAKYCRAHRECKAVLFKRAMNLTWRAGPVEVKPMRWNGEAAA